MTDDPRKWVQIASWLREQIETGQLEPHTPVFIGDESRAWKVSRDTVSKALHALEEEGRLRRFPGHGYIVVPPGGRRDKS